MRQRIAYAHEQLTVEVPEAKLVGLRWKPPTPCLDDPAAALRTALESPLHFPPLRRALTPDDQVTLVVGEDVPQQGALLTALFEHLAQAGVVASAVTLLLAAGTPPGWQSGLPEEHGEARVEVHDPSDRGRLSYLATTRRGRRLYLNRSVVDADQLVVLSRRGYDPLLGYSGGAGAIYPVLSDEATHREMAGRLTEAAPSTTPCPVREEAREVAWLLGAPFLVQVIEGEGEDIAHFVCGPADTEAEAVSLLDARWRVRAPQLADVVVAGLAGGPDRLDFAALARAAACAARVVKPDGRIVVLAGSTPVLGPGAGLLRGCEDPAKALDLVREQAPHDFAAAFQWASAARHGRIYLLSGLPEEEVEELFAVPLEHAGQVQRLVDAAGSCLFLPDAHKTLALVE
jgi:nickel-dependent lactate racemase